MRRTKLHLRAGSVPNHSFLACRWYRDSADDAWGDDKPTLQETRVHAKCLRSVSSVRDYFREYRAKKKVSKRFVYISIVQQWFYAPAAEFLCNVQK
jgi:hypothetical protein